MTVKKEQFLYFLITLAIITTSGCNWTISFLAGAALATLIVGRKISVKNILIACILSLLLFLNSYVFSIASFDMHEYAVYLVRFFGIAIIAAYINYTRFMEMYVKILYWVFVVSLCFWVIALYCYIAAVDKTIFKPFFDLFIMESSPPRLKSIFWEGGVCAIHANIGLTYCIYNGLHIKKNRNMMVVFLLAVLCSFSTTGYIVLILQAFLYCYKMLRGTRIPRRIIIYVGIAFTAFLIEEFTAGIIIGKLFGQQKSFSSRFDDTILAFIIAKDHFWTGVGVAADHRTIFLEYFYHNNLYKSFQKYFMSDLASSNGLGNCMYRAGVPFTMAYLCMIYHMVRKRANFPMIESLILLVMYICFFFGEPIMPVPLMLMFFYAIKMNSTKMRVGNQI